MYCAAPSTTIASALRRAGRAPAATIKPTVTTHMTNAPKTSQPNKTAATAVLFSLLVARLLTPMMAAYLLKPHADNIAESRLMISRIIGMTPS